ncbi:hypothetical protein GCM10017772_04880 [Promicromonospora soli]|uniref:Uncharacterized protein n=1 Tax=Promicromonospora soli TaxID=2035533 RepID=A0A919FHR3_9MICO|nr:hypothetical protein GCM10017772_04880 [Promicromonospora soli]
MGARRGADEVFGEVTGAGLHPHVDLRPQGAYQLLDLSPALVDGKLPARDDDQGDLASLGLCDCGAESLLALGRGEVSDDDRHVDRRYPT